MTAETPTRRTVLTTGVATVGAAAGAVALAACGSSDSGTSSSSSGSSGGSPAAAPASGTSVASLSEISVGSAKAVEIGGKKAIVARPAENNVVAFDAACTHQGCAVNPSGNKLNCPCHGSVFNALTGAVEKGPAKTPLPSIAVKVENGKVVTA
ncbi:MAG TPA: Rieske (2Fe-2S) protein [Amycolatopsis sp.]|uniref:Rieske (2Fe-2S) protein n=1 Tax=Amycolatopsis sp. TaxID=37632 RepID=UPI002B489625|nr:Rieske (2Fe-2S) protein [Amycolatopsis sp.]HKS46803.1 Rieske (2Fe-2S) protein [Amycolatopsis sp.]